MPLRYNRFTYTHTQQQTKEKALNSNGYHLPNVHSAAHSTFTQFCEKLKVISRRQKMKNIRKRSRCRSLQKHIK